MKKKIRLRKWVEDLLIIINIIMSMCMGAEIEDLMHFITANLAALSIFMINNYLLYKYTDLFDKR